MQHMYRDAENEPAYMADQVAEHNRLVAFYEGDRGQERAQKAYEYWGEEYERNPSPLAVRMGNIAGGLAGFFEPWMTLVGHLTVSDTRHLEAPDQPPDPPDTQQLANMSEIDRINRALSNRQENEAAELLFQQRSQTHGDPTPWQQELYPKQCEALEKIDRVGLQMAARSFERKRTKVKKLS